MQALDLTMPWWMFVVRGAVTYVGLLVLMRLTGKRSLGELSPFDMLVLILAGGTLRTAIVGNDDSLLAAFIGIATILALNHLFAYLAARMPRFNRIIEGTSSVLVERGRVDAAALRRHNVPRAMLDRALRTHDLDDVRRAKEVRLEANGKISVIPGD
ncbi:DUF421 domain-containing protein [Dyella sp. 2RAB6]|uniref:DUF421 domain-containing protein n=1 Tax=Dyella sp. 2RAB6 TaxID=3232992 RepID=UPI003F9157B1